MTREEARQGLQGYSLFIADGTDLKEALNMAIEALHREEAEENGWCHRIIPSNVEVVVRCKDCRWWSCKVPLHQHNSHLCRYWESTNTSADDFCSRGERREP